MLALLMPPIDLPARPNSTTNSLGTTGPTSTNFLLRGSRPEILAL